MKVRELVQILEQLDQDQVIRVVVPIEGRPHGGGFLKEVSEVSEIFDQDTNKPSYVIHISDFNEK
ncbi:hypothetical protein RE628_04465 [Paenibacillus sp. D2_2]|uniref:hypothetical protein n=1 Tax=Paenibacillus sp. D2_2 TaxID=3073092 RepID=UPI00281621C4|nr:hypothetical protein [Paenibacillus sp. D2_2]WMT41749.1 hypothetical protein RE628_04465 [Paenibacillus sp. D2_2]